MKITKTQLRNLIKEEIGKVAEEQKLDEFFGPFKKKKKKSARAQHDQEVQEAWDDMGYSERKNLLKDFKASLPLSGPSMDRDEMLKIPRAIRDELRQKADEREAEKKAGRERAQARRQKERDEESARNRAADEKYYAARRREREEEEKRERYRKSGYKGGSLSGEGSPSAPWDE